MADREQLLSAVRDSIEAYCDVFHDFTFKPNDPAVRLHEPTFGADEIVAAVECLLSTRVTMGSRVKGFERAFADQFGYGHGIMNNSGSSANLLAVAALANATTENRLEPGDEVIVPALSWSTTVWPVIQHNLVPVIVDIDPNTLNMDPNEVERAIGPKTRAVIPVHVYGNPCDMDAITDICARHDLILIEDCCEALGAAYDGKPVGAFGRVGTFSFYYSHHITTLEGGICVTGDFELAESMRILRAHGWVRELEVPGRYTARHPEFDPGFLFVIVGYNLRPTEVQAAIGSVQLPKLSGSVDVRREYAANFRRDLDRFGDVLAFQQETPKGRHSWFGFPITIRDGAPFTATEVRSFLAGARIETRPIICGNIAAQPAFAHYEHRAVGDLRHSNHVMHGGFTFGNHHAVDAPARDYVIAQVADFMSAQRSRK